MEMYVEKYGNLPPYVTYGRNKNPHSWRIMVMEFIHPETYKIYDFSLPWSHEHNRKVARTHNFFTMAADDPASCQFFRLVLPAVDGEKESFENRFVLIEHRHKNISWTEPRDLTLEEIDDELIRDEPHVYIFHKGQTRLRADADPALVREAFAKRLDAQLISSLLLASTPKALEGQ